MAVFYNYSKETTDVYIREINTHTTSDGIRINENGQIKIVFINKKFDHCGFPFKGPYTRSMWVILKEIEKEISIIEEMYKHPDLEKENV